MSEGGREGGREVHVPERKETERREKIGMESFQNVWKWCSVYSRQFINFTKV